MVTPISKLDLASIHRLVFAGGGNRCWWQAGAMRHFLEAGWSLPDFMVGTSAGAAVAASCLAASPEVALEGCIRLYGETLRLVDWRRSIKRFGLEFAHERIYPAWVASFINQDTIDRLRQTRTRLTVSLTRPARLLGLPGSIAAGTLAYMVDKHLWHSIHPRLPKRLGLRQDFVALQECATLEEVQSVLVAAAAAPPFIPSRVIGGGRVIDGGYVDNAPIPLQSEEDDAATLVLLTRHYPKLPQMFRWKGRAYWQPSQKVPVSTWDCTRSATVRDAFTLGVKDASDMLGRALITIGKYQ